MKIQILAAAVAATLLVGCAATKEHMGASAENDQNVLTGGPTFGTTIDELPQPVKDTLQNQVPHAEISNINKMNKEGQVVYEISFLQPGTNPVMYIREDGKVLTGKDMVGSSSK